MENEENDDWGDDWEMEEEEDEDDEKMSVAKKSRVVSAIDAIAPVERRALFSVLEIAQISKLIARLHDEVKDVLSVTDDEVGVLLRAYRWKKSKLIDDWMVDPEKVKASHGVKFASAAVSCSVAGPCPVCTEDRLANEFFALGCGHAFCAPCWRNWLLAEMDKGPTAIFSKCPQHKCNETIPQAVYRTFLAPSMFERYNQFVVASFVQGIPSLKWCPAPGCNRAIEYTTGGTFDVTCTCGNRFCFGCERVAHRPVPCALVEKWQLKNASESENANWIMANTKVCPKCKVPIEKNQGCNHMSCKICKAEWCWLCKGDWAEHGSATGGFYNCNKYSEIAKRGAVDDEQKNMDKASNALQRYLHYFSRFDNHAKAVKFAERTLTTTEVRMKELQDLKGVGFMDVQFLLNAVTAVISCRHVLQWTYAYGYYLEDKTTQKSLFENFQEQLEKFCEHLHELAEKPLVELQEIRVRTDVINYTRVTEKYRDSIVHAVEGGNLGSSDSV